VLAKGPVSVLAAVRPSSIPPTYARSSSSAGSGGKNSNAGCRAKECPCCQLTLLGPAGSRPRQRPACTDHCGLEDEPRGGAASAGVKTFHVLPRLWVVERTFAWIVKCFRLDHDYEGCRRPARR
jgi:hypothetical protein